MGSTADEEEALSDFEDDAIPVVLPASAPAPSADGLKTALAELESERQARKAVETEKAALQSTLTRVKTFAQEAVRQRDEAVVHREEAHRLKEELAKQLKEALQRKDDAIRQRDETVQQRDEAIKLKDEVSRQRDEASKTRDASRSEIEVAARLLVAGAEKITSRASTVKSFPGNLPRSSSHTGVAAIAYGFTKRAEEIVDELVRQHESGVKNRSEMRQQVEQRNYQIAIEVSELEASIQQLKSELTQKSQELEKWQKLTADKEGRISEVEQEMVHKLGEAAKETESFKNAALVAEGKAKVLESKIEKLKPSISELLHLILRANETLTNLPESFSTSTQLHPASKSASPSLRGEPEEGVQECITRLKELAELCLKLGSTWKEHREVTKREMDDLEGTITRLIIEKKEITNFLRSALANKQEALEAVSKSTVDSNHKLNTASKNWETRNENIGPNSDRRDGNRSGQDATGNVLASRTEGSLGDELKTGEAISMASALENEVKSLRQEIFELQQFLAVARGEVEWLRVTSERQTKELSEKAAKIQDLEEKEIVAQENVEGLGTELAAAEEEIGRWRQAATEEAAAGAAVLEEVERCQEEITVLKQQVVQLSQSLEDANNKLRSKEEMATAAIAARNAAERSLRIADERAVELRERIEEMTRQFEELDGRGEGGGTMGLLDLCWPYQWFRGRPNFNQRESAVRVGAEMEELLEPLV